jgi:hypothetical protein
VAADVRRSDVTSMSEVRTLTFVVPDPPPMRTHPGRSADRRSPHAAALAAAGKAAVSAHPDKFPFRFAGMTVRFGKTMWDVDPLGYQPDHPIIEVLADVGAVTDPESWWSKTSRDPESAFYLVTFTSEEA